MRRLYVWAIRAARAGRGRWLGLLLLILLTLPLAFPDWSPFKRLRLAWFDLYQITLPRERHSGPVTVVAVDESSLRQIGQWPWPRTILAELIERIANRGALAIGLDILMPEQDQTSPEALASRMDPDYQAVIDALASMPAQDALLGYTIKRFPVVLGAAGFDSAAPSTSAGMRTWPVNVRGGEITARMRQYPYALASLARFQAAASGQGLLSADLERGVLRRVPLVSMVGNAMVPSLSIELLRVAMGADAVGIEVDRGAIAALTLGDLRIPTQPGGELWLHFTRFMPERYIPAVSVLQDRVDAEYIKDKIVIVALTGLGLVDYKTTALGEYVPGVDAHAQLIESFFDSRFLRRPVWAPWAEVGALISLGTVLLVFVPGMRRHYAVFTLIGMLAGLAAAGFLAFSWGGQLFDAASLITALCILFAGLIASALVQADRERRTSQRSLRLAREANARVAGELEAARRIQLGVLPRSESSFPGEQRFDLAAEIEPARAVGGDLYDFFMLDRDRLFVLVADVSGKGIPASLFMSVTKALTKSIALRTESDASRVLTQANIEISRDNPESLFVTAFAAVLDVRTGHMRYWTAGHDTPFLFGAGGVRQIDRSESGPPLCVVEDYDYHTQELTLAPGEGLVLFTDGISEAEDKSGRLYGKERMALCIAELPRQAPAAEMLRAIRGDVKTFAAGAAPSDDLTLLVLRWFGPPIEGSARVTGGPPALQGAVA